MSNPFGKIENSRLIPMDRDLDDGPVDDPISRLEAEFSLCTCGRPNGYCECFE